MVDLKKNGSILFQEEKKGDVLILHLNGRLDALSTPDAEKKVLHFVELGERKILLDFTHVDYISSAGMRMLLTVIKRLKSVSGQMVLCCITTNVMDVFKMSGFDHVLDLSKNETDALNKF